MTAAAKHLVLIAASLLAPLTFAQADEAAQNSGASEPATVFPVDDQTGEELALKHGIQPIAATDLEVLINGVLRGNTPVRLFHQAVASLQTASKYRERHGKSMACHARRV